LDLAIDSPARALFIFQFVDEQLAFNGNQRYFWNPAVVSYPMAHRCYSELTILFSIVACIVYSWYGPEDKTYLAAEWGMFVSTDTS
jgi:hypothetical protein